MRANVFAQLRDVWFNSRSSTFSEQVTSLTDLSNLYLRLQACGHCIMDSVQGSCRSSKLHSMIAGSGRATVAHLNSTPGSGNVLLLTCRSCHLAESKLDLHHSKDDYSFAAMRYHR